MSDFKTFMSLTDRSMVKEITSILECNQLNFRMQDTSRDFDPTMANNEAYHSTLVMLDPKDFEKANVLLEEHTPLNIAEIDPSHPLFSFSNDELKEVVKNYDEWHPLDVKLAKYLLQKQNITVGQNEIKEQQHVKELKAGEHEKSGLQTLIMGYLFCLMGGLAGIGIALYLLFGKKTLPDGSKKYLYAERDRRHGFYMLLLGAIVFTLLLTY